MAINTLHNLEKQRLIIKIKIKTASTHPNTLTKWGGGGVKGRLIVSAIKILFKIHKMCGILT